MPLGRTLTLGNLQMLGLLGAIMMRFLSLIWLTSTNRIKKRSTESELQKKEICYSSQQFVVVVITSEECRRLVSEYEADKEVARYNTRKELGNLISFFFMCVDCDVLLY